MPDSRPLPRWYLRLPVAVTDAPSLARHLREAAARSPEPILHRLVRTIAARLENAGDAAAVRQISAWADAEQAAATTRGDESTATLAEGLAYAVDRVAEWTRWRDEPA